MRTSASHRLRHHTRLVYEQICLADRTAAAAAAATRTITGAVATGASGRAGATGTVTGETEVVSLSGAGAVQKTLFTVSARAQLRVFYPINLR